MNSTLNKWAKNWIFYHIIFWLFITFTFAWDLREYAPYDLKGYVSSVFIRIGLQASLMYINLVILIPKIYPKSRLAYWTLLVLTIYIFIMIYKPVYFMTSNEVREVYIPPTIDTFFNRLFIAIRALIYSFTFKFIKDWFEQEKKISQIKVDQLSTELKYLRAQINPHFLFNTLNNLYGLALIKSNKTPEVIMRLSDIMDYMLYESSDAKVPLRKDVGNLINYVEIEKLRQGNNARINFTISGDIKMQKIIPLLMLPLLENGFKHGVNKEPENAYLDATLNIHENSLEFQVTNNKSNILLTSKSDHGIGMQNLIKRLDLFYPKKYKLNIIDKTDSFTVDLKIELI